MIANRRVATATSLEVALGMTLIDVLAIMACTAILMALLAPVVQATREAARRLGCVNNLKQIGLALENYESAHGVLPPSGIANSEVAVPELDHSMKTRLLCYLEQVALCNSLNFSEPINPYQLGRNYYGNVTASSTTIATFLCPSDGNLDTWPMATLNGVVFNVASTNYPNNMGVAPTYTGMAENGPAYFLNQNRWSQSAVGIVDVRDGTSQTAMFSEYLKYAGIGQSLTAPINRLRAMFWIDWTTNTGSPLGDSRVCQATELMQGNYKGEYWAQHDPGRGGGYFHTNLPNTKSCNGGWYRYGWVSASSAHPGGVNVLFMDGSVHFIKDTINYGTWLGLGTIAGGELTGSDQY